MNTLAYVKQADRLFFDRLSYSRSFSYFGTTVDADLGPFGFCLPKPAGKLAFTLNTQTHLRFDYGIDVDLEFTGTESDPDGAGNRTILWRLEQPLDVSVPFPWAAEDLKFHSVEGSFRTSLHELPTPRAKFCGGEVRDFHVRLGLTGDDNHLTAHGGVGVLDADSKYTLRELDAHAADASTLVPRIEPVRDECGVSGVRGGLAKFRVVVSGLQPYQHPTYLWTAPNIQGSKTGAIVHVKLPSQGKVLVKVAVKVGSKSMIASLDYTPLEATTATLIHLFCRVRGEMRRVPFVDPLWDPPRDLMIKPPSFADAERLLEAIDNLRALGSAFRAGLPSSPPRAVRGRRKRARGPS